MYPSLKTTEVILITKTKLRSNVCNLQHNTDKIGQTCWIVIQTPNIYHYYALNKILIFDGWAAILKRRSHSKCDHVRLVAINVTRGKCSVRSV